MKSKRASIAELHWPLIVVVLLISVLGIYNLHSSAAARDPDLYFTQFYAFLLGAVLIGVLLSFDYRVTESFAYIAYAIVCLLLLAVLFQGKTAGGAQRWLVVGSVNLQPSELAKLATVLCLARYFSHRMRQDGYSIHSLFRPLNPSRPLAVLAVLAVAWNHPALVDPIGEFARFIHGRTTAPQELGNLAWFRTLLCMFLLAGLVGAILMTIRWEKRQALLNPWPPGRKKRLIFFFVVVTLILAALLAWVWNAPLARDPFGVAIAYLHRGAAVGGPYHVLEQGFGLRVVLVLLGITYLLGSLVSLRFMRSGPTDLVLAPIDLLLIPALLILVEPDLGTAGVVVLIGLSMILIVGVRFRSLLLMTVLGTLVAGIAWFGVLKDYQKRRILTFLEPENDLKGAGWNAIQSMIAVGSGRWWGKGHMEGTQSQLSFLPEQHTDFAFSVWAEEQGFVGCLILLTLYLLLLGFAIAIAMSSRDTYGTLLAVGIAAIILWQTLINIGMVIGLAPVVGLTLPLFSYGGSSLLTVMLGIGILLNVHWRRRAH